MVAMRKASSYEWKSLSVITHENRGWEKPISVPRTPDFENIGREMIEDLSYNHDKSDISASLNDQVLATREKT